METRLRVLLIDDEESLRLPLKKYLETKFGYHVDAVASGEEALQEIEKAQGCYDVALIDDLLIPRPGEEPRFIGIELMCKIKERYPRIEAIVFTGWSTSPDWDRGRILKTLRAGAFRYLVKPFDNDELAMLIRTAAQQVRLREIGRTILLERDLDRVLRDIASAACSLALADDGSIALLERATGKIRVHAKVGPWEQVWKKHFKKQGLSREIILTGRIEYVPDTTQDKRVNPEVIDAGIRSFLGLPIPGEGGNLGVLYVYSHQPGRFDEGSTLAVLQGLAGQAGLAIANAGAFQEVQAHARYMEALVRAGQGFARATTEEELLTLTWHFVREQLNVSTFFVALYDQQTDKLRFPIHYDGGQPVPISDLTLGDDPERWSVTGYVVRKGQEILWFTGEEREQQCRRLGIKALQVGKPCESCLFLPLKAGDDVIGVMSIQSYMPHAFSPILLDACRALGSQLSVALESVRLFEAEARRRQEAETLREAALALTTTLEREKVFERILAELQKVVPYDSASVQLLKDDRLEIIGGRGFPNLSQLLGLSFSIDGDNPNREVVRQKAPFIVPDAPAVYRGFTEEPHIQAGIRGWLGVPMLLGDRLIGMIALDKREPGFYTEEHAGLAQAFATQAAIAIENARLFQESKEGRDYIRSLYEGSTAIILPTEPGQVLQAMVDTICQTTGAWRAAVLLADEGEEPQVLAQSGFDLHLDPATSIRREGISRQVIRTRQSCFFPDTLAVINEVHPKMIEQGARAAACLPLLLRDRVIGVLWIHYREVHHFSEVEQQALQVYASQAAIAYDHARRIRELEQMRQAAEAMSRAVDPRQALWQIVDSAAQVLGADSAALWSYDDVQGIFVPEELVAVGIPNEELQKFREEEHKPGRTADRVMQQGYLSVTDITRPEYGFLGESTQDLLDRIGVRSFQGIALQVGDEQLGVLYANYKHPRAFGEEEEKKLRTFASHAALALKNARLLTQMQRTKEAAGVIAGVMLQEKLNQTLKTIAGHAQQVLRSDVVTIYSYDEASGRFGEWASEIRDPREPNSARPPEELMPDSVVWRILDMVGPTYYCLAQDRAGEHALLGGRFIQAEEIQAALGIQLRVGERRVGVMFVDFRSPHRFTADEMATIQLFADQAAVAISNARQYAEIVRDVELRQGLLRAGREIMALQEPKAVLQNIVEIMREALACDVVTLYSYDQAREEIDFPAYKAGELYDQKSIDELGYVSKDSVVGKLLASGEPHFADDAPADPIMSTGGFVARERIKSSAGIPLKSGDQVIGIVFVNYRTPHPFSPQEQEALLLFATQAAIAIQNARRYEELRRTKGLVGARTALAWMGMASSAWRHAIDKHAVTIREQSKLLRMEMHKPSLCLKSIGEKLDTIERLATQILEKPIVPPLSREEGVELVGLNDLVSERARQLWQNEPYRKAKLRLDLQLSGAATVRVSPEWLRRAFDVLVENAVEAVANREVREITIGTRPAGDGAEIFVSDTGPGIPEEIQKKVGMEAIEKPEDAKGLGMGLLIAQTIVQTYDGELRVGLTGPTGTTMVIWLPLTTCGSAGGIARVS